jgi:hypothetical protein
VETRDALGDDEKVSIFGMPEDSDWVLYAPYPDKTLIRNTLTFDLHRQMGHYSSRSRHVEVVLNGEYWGVYEWLEKIDRSPGRVAISDIDPIDIAGDALTGGYIWKVDKLTGEVGFSWVSLYSDEVTFQVHYPKIDDITPEQQQYARGTVNGFEAMLASPQFADPQSGYPAWIDVQSFMDFMILQELGRTIDGYRSSSFFYKDRDSIDSRIKAGPMWDFNLSYGNADYCDAFLTTGYQYDFDLICGEFFDVEIPFWWKRLLEDPAFANALRCRARRPGICQCAALPMGAAARRPTRRPSDRYIHRRQGGGARRRSSPQLRALADPGSVCRMEPIRRPDLRRRARVYAGLDRGAIAVARRQLRRCMSVRQDTRPHRLTSPPPPPSFLGNMRA